MIIKNNVGEPFHGGLNLADVDNITRWKGGAQPPCLAFLRKRFVIFLLYRSIGASLQLVPDEATLGLEALRYEALAGSQRYGELLGNIHSAD